MDLNDMEMKKIVLVMCEALLERENVGMLSARTKDKLYACKNKIKELMNEEKVGEST